MCLLNTQVERKSHYDCQIQISIKFRIQSSTHFYIFCIENVQCLKKDVMKQYRNLILVCANKCDQNSGKACINFIFVLLKSRDCVDGGTP